MMAANEIRPYAGISLYVHVPFCQTKCPYCDFNTYQGIEALMTPYLDALATEIRLWGETLGRPTVDTIFFGGGTPSYMPPEQVARLLESVSKAFALSPDAEVTLEANPGDVTGPALESWRQAGVNRLSIGVQSLDDSLLTLLGRRHTAAQAQAAYGLAVASGLENVNLDLMYGLPSQTLERWRDTLEGVLELSPLHLSLYALTLEEGTPLARWVEEGKVPDPDPDLAADMYGLARELLGRSGYDHYEISNWSVAGRRCRHTGSTASTSGSAPAPIQASKATGSGTWRRPAPTWSVSVNGTRRGSCRRKDWTRIHCIASGRWTEWRPSSHRWRWPRPCSSVCVCWTASAPRASRHGSGRTRWSCTAPRSAS